MSSIFDVIQKRRSVRKYKPEQITEAELARIVEAGRLAPSGSNSQTAHFVVVQSPAIFDELRALVQEEFAKMEYTEDTYVSIRNAIKRSKDGKYNFMYNPPTFIIAANKRGYGNAMADCALALGNMMLMAAELGICLLYTSSADCLEALGAKIALSAKQSEKLLHEINLCFMFAPTYHASMKYAGPVRKQLGVRTIFNILGPLANPAGANMQLLGVYDEALVEPLARVLANLGVKRGAVVHGHDGLDEITLCGATTVCEISGENLNSFFLSPEQFGLARCERADLVGGGPEENARIARDILGGKPGPKRDIVVLNSAVCLYMSHNQKTLRECVRMAEDLIDSGAAAAQMERFVHLTNEVQG